MDKEIQRLKINCQEFWQEWGEAQENKVQEVEAPILYGCC
jgi:hypothetical protein